MLRCFQKHAGLKWGEGCNLVDVAFGIKKVRAACLLSVALFWAMFPRCEHRVGSIWNSCSSMETTQDP
jgi:hypothetical protein